MKAVLISIQPKWCDLIASGKKTLEVRKTRPKLETPFKVYIYCTKAKHGWIDFVKKERIDGKVIGEFVCDMIHKCSAEQFLSEHHKTEFTIPLKEFAKESCLSVQDLKDYEFSGDGHNWGLFGWHISDLVIYDKPKQLLEFQKCPRKLPFDPVTRPPQSWCYVEEVPDNGNVR